MCDDSGNLYWDHLDSVLNKSGTTSNAHLITSFIWSKHLFLLCADSTVWCAKNNQMLRNHLRCKNDCGGNHVVFCPGYNPVLQARNCALELHLLGHFISRRFWCWRDAHSSLRTRNAILPTQAANNFFSLSHISYCLKEIYLGFEGTHTCTCTQTHTHIKK